MGPLHVLYPKVFRVVSNTKSYVSDYYEWRGNKVSWSLSFRRGLHQFEESQYGELSSFLSNLFFAGQRILAFGNLYPSKFFW